MAVKTEFSEADIQLILSNYQVGKLESFSPLSAGTVQTIFVITTSQGKWILKYYENRPLESVQFEANVVEYISQKDFPCAHAIRNRHGRFVGEFQHKPYVVFEFMDGQTVKNLNPVQREQIIHTAAMLQVMTKDYTPRHKQFRWNYTPELVRNLSRLKADEIGTENARRKAQWFDSKLNELQLPTALPKGICHCDYDPSNILFNGDQVAALLDFDDANYTYLLFDLVNLIDGWAWPFGGEFSPEFARQIVQTYMQGRPLNALERRHLFDVHKLQILIDGIWFFGRGTVDDFYERNKLAYLDQLGRQVYTEYLFG